VKVAGFLAEILAAKRLDLERLGAPQARERLARKLEKASPARSFATALKPGEGYRIIAEMKRASPSRGVLSSDYYPERLAKEYEAGGAAALSVLTEARFFQGEPEHLEAVRRNSGLPILRKDFILEELQVEESRAMGADAILLIVAILEPRALRRLLESAVTWGMQALVEVHDSDELSSALDAGATLVGVNNRDLATFRVDLRVSLDLAERFPEGVCRVSESGLSRREDLERLSRAGYDAFLVGEALMKSPARASRLREWVG
jgi:indole-3-glycerol phosphate synthase